MPNVVLVVLNLFTANLSYSTPAVDYALLDQTIRHISAPAQLQRTHFEKSDSSNKVSQARQTTRFEDELRAAVDRQNQVLDLQIHNYYSIAESA